jgi:hypothetical protein
MEIYLEVSGMPNAEYKVLKNGRVLMNGIEQSRFSLIREPKVSWIKATRDTEGSPTIDTYQTRLT